MSRAERVLQLIKEVHGYGMVAASQCKKCGEPLHASVAYSVDGYGYCPNCGPNRGLLGEDRGADLFHARLKRSLDQALTPEQEDVLAAHEGT